MSFSLSAPTMSADMGQWSDLLHGHHRFLFMAAGVELRLFTILARTPGIDEGTLQAQLGLEDRPCRVLLFACASVGLIRKENGRFFNSVLGERLADDHPESLADFVRWEQLRYRGMGWFVESLKQNTNLGLQEFPGEGSSLYDRVDNNPAIRPLYHKLMGLVSERIVAAVLESHDFGVYRHVLDVGGGAATVWGRALAQRWPEIRVTVLDLPEVAALARQRFANEGLSDRMDAVGVDCLKEEFPKGTDCILFSRFLEAWSVDRIRMFLQKAERAVDPGGSVLVVTPLCRDGIAPVHSAYVAAYFQTIATTGGTIYTEEEFELWMLEAGLRLEPESRVRTATTLFLQGVKPLKR